ncbi:MAG: ATPase [Fulvimarina sp.]|nr:ATPase [Fulvimarina sp.]
MADFVIISGCSGGGKSTLLAELARRGQRVVEEPGRRIVAEERRTGGSALPWLDPVAFARRAVAMAEQDCTRLAGAVGPVFLDRGLIDATTALEHATGKRCLDRIARRHRFHRRVFMTPPWPEIFLGDADRRHGLGEAMAEYERLQLAYRELGYRTETLPKSSVASRADHVVATLQRDGLVI